MAIATSSRSARAGSPVPSPGPAGAGRLRAVRDYLSPAEWTRVALMAAAVVAAHNHVLRRWLRGECPDPVAEVDLALRQVIELFTAPGDSVNGVDGGDGTTIIAFRSGQDIEALLPALRRLADSVPSGSA